MACQCLERRRFSRFRLFGKKGRPILCLDHPHSHCQIGTNFKKAVSEENHKCRSFSRQVGRRSDTKPLIRRVLPQKFQTLDQRTSPEADSLQCPRKSLKLLSIEEERLRIVLARTRGKRRLLNSCLWIPIIMTMHRWKEFADFWRSLRARRLQGRINLILPSSVLSNYTETDT